MYNILKLKKRRDRMKLLLNEVRSMRDISLRELEKITGIGKSTLCRYETIGNASADIEKLERIAKALGVKITDLFESDYK